MNKVWGKAGKREYNLFSLLFFSSKKIIYLRQPER